MTEFVLSDADYAKLVGISESLPEAQAADMAQVLDRARPAGSAPRIEPGLILQFDLSRSNSDYDLSLGLRAEDDDEGDTTFAVLTYPTSHPEIRLYPNYHTLLEGAVVALFKRLYSHLDDSYRIKAVHKGGSLS